MLVAASAAYSARYGWCCGLKAVSAYKPPTHVLRVNDGMLQGLRLVPRKPLRVKSRLPSATLIRDCTHFTPLTDE